MCRNRQRTSNNTSFDSSHFVVPAMGTATSVAVAQIYSKRKLHYYNQTVFFKDWTQTPWKSQWIQKAGDELLLLPLAFLTAGTCDVVIPTLSNSEKISPFCFLAFFLLYWEKGFSNNSHLLSWACKPSIHHNIWNSNYWVKSAAGFELQKVAMHQERWWKGVDAPNNYSLTLPALPKQLGTTSLLFLSNFLFSCLTFLAPALPRRGHVDSKWHFNHRDRSQAQYIIKNPTKSENAIKLQMLQFWCHWSLKQSPCYRCIGWGYLAEGCIGE